MSEQSDGEIEQTFVTLMALLKEDDRAAIEERKDLLGDSKGHVIKCAGALRDRLGYHPDTDDLDPSEVFD